MSLRTPIGVLSFPHLFKPRPPAPGADPRFSATLIFTKAAQSTPEYKALRAAVAQSIDERWGNGRAADRAFVAKLRLPFRKASDKSYAGYEDPEAVFINAWSQDKPGVVDAMRQDILVPGDIWPGQLARFTVRTFAYDTSGNRGISFNLNNVQICRTDTPRLDGRKAAHDDFSDYADANGLTEMVDEDVPF